MTGRKQDAGMGSVLSARAADGNAAMRAGCFAGPGWELLVRGLGALRLAFLAHCQEVLIKKSCKGWEHMFIL